MSSPATDRRQHARHPLATSVEFYHHASRKTIAGRCVDISAGGMMMYVPASTPVRPGQIIDVSMGMIPRPEFANLSDTTVSASVARVDRTSLLSLGHLAVGIRFAKASGSV
jgi:c-di-GMP-binding flagellar brake protein YcgR